MPKRKKKAIIIFFGPPGSGKGTQSDILGKKINLPVISPGELLRHEVELKTATGKTFSTSIARGRLVPAKIVNEILEKRLADKDVKTGFILDGYPRNRQQLNFLVRKLKNISSVQNKIAAINITVSDQEVKRRMTGRRVCDCGESYHLKYNPPARVGFCDKCGNKLSQRSDDAPLIVAKRLSHFHKSIKPLINYFAKHYQLIDIDGEQSIARITQDILLKLNKIIE